jgi:hypothetical protein
MTDAELPVLLMAGLVKYRTEKTSSDMTLMPSFMMISVGFQAILRS